MAAVETPVHEPTPVPTPEVKDELHLLIRELDSELSAYRWRQAIWVSVGVHVVAFLALIFVPRWLPKAIVVVPAMSHKQATFVLLPNDHLHITAPKTDNISDKNRLAQSRTPVPSKQAQPKLLSGQQPGT